MRTGGTLAVLVAAAALALSGCSSDEPAPHETLDATTLAMLNEQSFDCLDGDMAACNRLRAVARADAPGSNYERIGATCGETLDEELAKDETCPVP